MTLDSSRMGTFVVTFDLIENVEEGYWPALMGDVVIVDAEVDCFCNQIVYTAISEKFSELTDTAQVPRYMPIWNSEEGQFTWRTK